MCVCGHCQVLHGAAHLVGRTSGAHAMGCAGLAACARDEESFGVSGLEECASACVLVHVCECVCVCRDKKLKSLLEGFETKKLLKLEKYEEEEICRKIRVVKKCFVISFRLK